MLGLICVKSKNEATFEARVNAEIKRIFPSLANLTIKHQLNFTVRLGHGTGKTLW